jgi:hypothetical protein
MLLINFCIIHMMGRFACIRLACIHHTSSTIAWFQTLEYVHCGLVCPNREMPVMHAAASMCKASLSCKCLPGLACSEAACSCNQASASPPASMTTHYCGSIAATSRTLLSCTPNEHCHTHFPSLGTCTITISEQQTHRAWHAHRA